MALVGYFPRGTTVINEYPGQVRHCGHALLPDTICPCNAEAPTVAAGAWSWVTAKFYKPAGQPEEGTPDEQLREQETEPHVQERKLHSGVHIVVCGECVYSTSQCV